MRACVEQKLNEIKRNLKMKGKALEIGGYRLVQCAKNVFPKPDFEYYNMDIEETDIPNTIISDITDCKNIRDESFDVVFCADVLEHITKPWAAAAEIIRILKPGGVVVAFTVWSWRYHPLPIDYWRFSPDCLKFLFSGLDCVEADFDMSMRRDDIRGFWENKLDYVPIDELGGWRENWSVFYVGKKPTD